MKTTESVTRDNTSLKSRPVFFQPKLTVNAPGDQYEQEADAMADKVMRMHAPAAQTFFKPAIAPIQRKCKGCEEDDKMLHRKEGAGAENSNTEGLNSYINSLGFSGQPLAATSRQFFEPRFDADFSNVRVHTDSIAAKSAQSINALAYTTGSNIVFNSGQYAPQSETGKKLIAHELTHVVQQTDIQQPVPIQRKVNSQASAILVKRVLLSCADKQIIFETTGSKYTYALTSCDLSEGQYDAAVSTNGSKVTFNLNKADKGLRFRFGYDVAPGQKNPATLFNGQKTVAIEATNKTLKSDATPIVDQTVVSRPTSLSTLDEFKTLVRNAGVVRMRNNIQALSEWDKFLTQNLTSKQLERQVRAQEMDQLTLDAEKNATVDTLNQYANTRNPAMREYEHGVITREKCPSCHAILGAEAYEKSLPAYQKQGIQWETPIQQLNEIAANEHATPSIRPGFLPAQPQKGELPDAKKIKKTMYPNASTLTELVIKIHPFLQQLGPNGFQVLPDNVVEEPSNPDLLSEIKKNIYQRQADFARAIVKFSDPDYNYMNLRPIVRDLMPLVSSEVQALVLADIKTAEKWDKVKAILIGLATLATLLMIIFPPTSALGLAGLTTLEAGLGAYSVYSGLQAYKQGYIYSLGKGANNVFDPEQQAAANSMMAMGLLTASLGLIGLRGAQVKTVKLINSLSKTAPGASTVLEGIEAQAGNNTIKISGLDTEAPQIKVTASDGTLIKDEPIPLNGNSEATTGDAALDGEIDSAFDRLEKGTSAGGEVKGPQQPLAVRVPVDKGGKPATVLEVGAGPKKVNLGIPPEKELVAVTRSDLSEAGEPDIILNATEPLAPALKGKFTTIMINNPYGYVANVAELGEGLAPEGKIIVQGNWAANKFFRKLGTMEVPSGFVRTVERDVQALGEGFSHTNPQGSGGPIPDARITFELQTSFQP